MKARMESRRAWLGACAAGALAAWVPWLALAQAAAPVLPRPTSLAAELERALAARKALVVMVSLEGCPWCKLARESYLVPLRAEGQRVVQIEMAGPIPLTDLRGRPSTHEQVVRALDVRVAPTVLFIGRGGVEVAPRLSGVASPDFYGAYLQDRVDAANRTVAG
ncbi:hypothetical protein [Ramlibacter sp.]|uniref:hypothetical protein n=1 Tax=Ramlibacter sp. TaxID=1917967 RepID=UPI002FCCAC8E